MKKSWMSLAMMVGVMALVLGLAGIATAGPATYSELILQDNPVGYWRLGETSGTTAVNSSVNGATLNGTYTGTGWTQGLAGPQDPPFLGLESDNKAPRFDGSNNFPRVSVGDNALLDITGNLTLEAWINCEQYGGGDLTADGIVAKNDAVNQRAYMLYQGQDGKIRFNLSGDGSTSATLAGSTLLPLNEWHYVVGVYTSGVTPTMQIYVNGVLETSTTLTGTIPTSIYSGTAPLWIGNRGSLTWVADPATFKGRIDEVAVYNDALSSEQIAAHYNFATNGPLVSGAPIAEPASLGLLGLALLGLRKRRS